MHISVDQHPTKDDISANIKQLAALNLTVQSEWLASSVPH